MSLGISLNQNLSGFVCKNHFSEDDMVFQLKPNAVPTLEIPEINRGAECVFHSNENFLEKANISPETIAICECTNLKKQIEKMQLDHNVQLQKLNMKINSLIEQHKKRNEDMRKIQRQKSNYEKTCLRLKETIEEMRKQRTVEKDNENLAAFSEVLI